MVPQILGGQAWWPSTIQQMISMRPFSQVTILQGRWSHCFLEHLCTIQQQQLYTMVSSYPLLYKPLIFFQLKTHTVCSRQTITSLHILCNAVCHGNIHQLKFIYNLIYSCLWRNTEYLLCRCTSWNSHDCTKWLLVRQEVGQSGYVRARASAECTCMLNTYTVCRYFPQDQRRLNLLHKWPHTATCMAVDLLNEIHG